MNRTMVMTGDLDSWTQHEWTGGVHVRGGARFPTFTAARLCGSGTGGTMLKRCGVYPGLRVELEVDERRVLTSTVQSVSVDPTPRNLLNRSAAGLFPARRNLPRTRVVHIR